MNQPLRTSDDGTVLLLILGLVVIAGLFVTVVMDVSALYLDRRSLLAAADGAALAGAQAVDERLLYEQGLPQSGSPLQLNESQARSSVENYLDESGVTAQYETFRVNVVTTPTTVSVQLQATVRLPVSNVVTSAVSGGVTIDASATARTALLP